MMDEWFYRANELDRGPVTLAKLKKLARRGTIASDTPVWQWGEPRHRAASQVPELAECWAARATAAYRRSPGTAEPRDDTGRFASGHALFWMRVMPCGIDSLLSLLVAALLIGMFKLDRGLSALLGWDVALCTKLWASLLVWWFFAVCEASPWQATPGKRLFGLRVVDREGRRISFLKASERFFNKTLSALFLGMGYLVLIWNRDRQTFHDWASGCLVRTQWEVESMRLKAQREAASQPVPKPATAPAGP